MQNNTNKYKYIFIEGLPGMGKSTLLNQLAKAHPEYQVFREGDYCPIELAWCAYMDERQYAEALALYPETKEEIEKWTVREQDKYIVSYTRILTDEPGFHKYMEQFEIYNGRKSAGEFKQIIFSRLINARTGEENSVFECAIFQNIIEELMLFQKLSDEEIITFYRELCDILCRKGAKENAGKNAGDSHEGNFRIYYLYEEDIEAVISHICKERSDEHGNQLWYPLMLRYLQESPYGKEHEFTCFGDVIAHFCHRQQLELRIIREIIKEKAIILPARSEIKDLF